MSFHDQIGRTYEKGNEEYASVTTILAKIAKPQLIQWAANCACEYIKERVADEHTLFNLEDALNEAAYAYKDKTDSAADDGTFIHDLFQLKILRKFPDALTAHPPEIEGVVQKDDESLVAYCNRAIEFMLQGADANMVKRMANLDLWINEYVVDVVAVEYTLYEDEEKYAGTCDLIALISPAAWQDTRTVNARKKVNKKWKPLPDKPIWVLVDVKTSKSYYDTFPLQLAAYRRAADKDPVLQKRLTGAIEAMGVLRMGREVATINYKDFNENVITIGGNKKFVGWQYYQEAFIHICRFFNLTENGF